MRLTDRDILYDCLVDTKYASGTYHHAVLEAANEPVRNVFKRHHDDELMASKMIFDALHQRGWYPVEAVSPARQQMAQPGPGWSPGFTPNPPEFRPERPPEFRPEQPRW
ncbi:MAG: Coat F domain protein [Clostridia bacterium 62_21]|nr:MAG: Coat F domain protein [Clostridia bacterium 62_21]